MQNSQEKTFVPNVPFTVHTLFTWLSGFTRFTRINFGTGCGNIICPTLWVEGGKFYFRALYNYVFVGFPHFKSWWWRTKINNFCSSKFQDFKKKTKVCFLWIYSDKGDDTKYLFGIMLYREFTLCSRKSLIRVNIYDIIIDFIYN